MSQTGPVQGWQILWFPVCLTRPIDVKELAHVRPILTALLCCFLITQIAEKAGAKSGKSQILVMSPNQELRLPYKIPKIKPKKKREITIKKEVSLRNVTISPYENDRGDTGERAAFDDKSVRVEIVKKTKKGNALIKITALDGTAGKHLVLDCEEETKVWHGIKSTVVDIGPDGKKYTSQEIIWSEQEPVLRTRSWDVVVKLGTLPTVLVSMEGHASISLPETIRDVRFKAPNHAKADVQVAEHMIKISGKKKGARKFSFEYKPGPKTLKATLPVKVVEESMGMTVSVERTADEIDKPFELPIAAD
jgi:hypothetical protein